MSESKVTTYLAFLIVGVGIGAGLALLFAPKSGKEARKYLARRAEDGRDYVMSVGQDLRRQAEQVVEKGKDWATRFAQ